MYEQADAQHAHKVPQSRREKRKEMNTAVCVNAVAKSSTILLPIVINKLGHSDPQGFSRSSNLDCISLQLDNQQDYSTCRMDHSTPWEQRVVSSKLHTSSKNINVDGELIVSLVLHSSNWEWHLTVHDFTAVALLNCEMVPLPSSVVCM